MKCRALWLVVAAATAEDPPTAAEDVMMSVDEGEAALLQYLRAVRQLKKTDQYFGMQQHFTPHPGRVFTGGVDGGVNSAMNPLIPRVDPYSVEGFYAPALWSEARHIAVTQPGTPTPLMAYVQPRALGKQKGGTPTGAPYWGYQQMFTPHPGKVYRAELPDYSDRVVLGGPHEFPGNGLMQQDIYRTDGVPTGGYAVPTFHGGVGAAPALVTVPVAPLHANADGIFPSPIISYSSGPHEFVSALYHPV